MPRMYIISGCNGSGKTTASYTLLPELLDCSEFVNSDEFAKSLAPFHPETAYITASRYMLKKLRYLFTRREDFCIETTLATRSLLKMVRMAQDQGYFVTVVYLWLRSPEIAVKRVAARVEAGGHDVAPDVIRRRYYTGLSTSSTCIRPSVTSGCSWTTARRISASLRKAAPRGRPSGTSPPIN